MKKKTKKTTKIKNEVKTDLFKVSVKVLGKFYNAQGATLEDAISKLDIKNPKGMSVWKVERNGKTREKVLQPFITANLFKAHGIYRDIAIKKFSLLFDNL